MSYIFIEGITYTANYHTTAWVRALVPQAEVWDFEFQTRQTKIVKNCSMAMSAEYIGEKLQPFTGNGDVSMSEKFSSGTINPIQTKNKIISDLSLFVC